MPEHAKISRVVLKNYKSIRSCDVLLGPITFLVGPNGAGKSNFVEALRFLSFGLSNSLESALDNRSGFRSIIRRGASKEATVSIEVSFRLEDLRTGKYLVEIGVLPDGSASVTEEDCSVGGDWFEVSEGSVRSNQALMAAASREKLYLVNASGLATFEPVYRALSNVLVYNPVPDEIRGSSPPRASEA